MTVSQCHLSRFTPTARWVVNRNPLDVALRGTVGYGLPPDNVEIARLRKPALDAGLPRARARRFKSATRSVSAYTINPEHERDCELRSEPFEPVNDTNQLPSQIESLISTLKRHKPHWGARNFASSLSGDWTMTYADARFRLCLGDGLVTHAER